MDRVTSRMLDERSLGRSFCDLWVLNLSLCCCAPKVGRLVATTLATDWTIVFLLIVQTKSHEEVGVLLAGSCILYV